MRSQLFECCYNRNNERDNGNDHHNIGYISPLIVIAGRKPGRAIFVIEFLYRHILFKSRFAVAIQRCVVIFHHRLQPDHHIIYLVYLVISLFVRHAAVHELVGAAYRVISPQYCSWLFNEYGDTWKTSCGHRFPDSFLIQYSQFGEIKNYKKIIPFAACPFCGRIPQNRGTLTVWIDG